MNYQTLSIHTIKTLAAIAKDADGSRAALQSIYLDQDTGTAVSTNAQVLLMHPIGVADGDDLPAGEYPMPGTVILPWAELLDAIKLHKPATHIPIVADPILGIINGKPAITVFQEVRPICLPLPEVYGPYPDYRQVLVDTGREHRTLRYAVPQLSLLMAAVHKSDDDDTNSIWLNVYEDSDTAATEFRTGGEFTGLIMPVRQKD